MDRGPCIMDRGEELKRIAPREREERPKLWRIQMRREGGKRGRDGGDDDNSGEAGANSGERGDVVQMSHAWAPRDVRRRLRSCAVKLET